MNKKEYLNELNRCLMSMPADEREAAIKYYDEFFEDAGEGAEQDVINNLGSAKDLAESIIGEQNFAGKSSTDYVPVKAVTVTQKKEMSTGMIVLIVILAVFASPILIGVGAAILGAIVGLVAAMFGVIVAIIAVVISFILGGFFGIFVSIAGFFVNPAGAMIGLTASMLMLSVGLFTLIPFVWLCGKGVPAVFSLIGKMFNRIFSRKKKQ